MIHLRPIAGVKPATITTPGATHELLVIALDPGQPLPDLDALGRGEASFRFLTPIDVVQQFTVDDDAQAAGLCELVVRACIDGDASPDQDWRSWWRRTIPAIAEQLRGGRHSEAAR